jgi:hypothetical protein
MASSKALLQAGIDLAGEAAMLETRAESLRHQIAKRANGGHAGEGDYGPVRETLRAAFGAQLRALEVLNYVRRAAADAMVEAQRAALAARMHKENEGDPTAAPAGSLHKTVTAQGMIVVSEEAVRRGLPAEVVQVCESHLEQGITRCERLRERETFLFERSRELADGPHVVGPALAAKGWAEAEGLLYHPRTRPISGGREHAIQWSQRVRDGSFQVVIKNWNEHQIATPTVNVVVHATWGLDSEATGGSKRLAWVLPAGFAWSRVFGIVGAGEIRVEVQSAGIRASTVEVLVRRLAKPAAHEAPQNGLPETPHTVSIGLLQSQCPPASPPAPPPADQAPHPGSSQGAPAPLRPPLGDIGQHAPGPAPKCAAPIPEAPAPARTAAAALSGLPRFLSSQCTPAATAEFHAASSQEDQDSTPVNAAPLSTQYSAPQVQPSWGAPSSNTLLVEPGDLVAHQERLAALRSRVLAWPEEVVVGGAENLADPAAAAMQRTAVEFALEAAITALPEPTPLGGADDDSAEGGHAYYPEEAENLSALMMKELAIGGGSGAVGAVEEEDD